jgi:hypothetical protein
MIIIYPMPAPVPLYGKPSTKSVYVSPVKEPTIAIPRHRNQMAMINKFLLVHQAGFLLPLHEAGYRGKMDKTIFLNQFV